MMMQIPHQLRDPDFRFFLIGKDSKTPIEKKWNTECNYRFFEPKLLSHISNGGNIGLCTGFGGVIVIDFDDRNYMEYKRGMLKPTFCVKTAGKGLCHYYYILDGEMPSKIGIGREHRLADIQASKSGVLCPPSHIKRRYYSPINNNKLEKVTLEWLSMVFGIRSFKKPLIGSYDDTPQPEKVSEMITLFNQIGIPRTKERHFKCPLHPMEGSGNLWVNEKGGAYCFHCQRGWKSANDFKNYWENKNGGIIIQ